MSVDVSVPLVVSMVIYLIGMVIIGLSAYRLTGNMSDYVLGGRRLGPGVAALSAGASDMSGWLLLGLPGAIYATGMNALWIGVGLTIGAYLNWQFVARRLRVYTEVAHDSITIPDYLENRFADRSKILRMISAIVILIFFAFYTSAGLVASAKLFATTFDMNYALALWGGGIVVISYTFIGGFLAASWTDFIQGIMMFFALLIVPAIALFVIGSWDEVVATVGRIDPSYNDIMSGMTLVGIISLLAWGLGYFGQPHILVQFMALRDHRDTPLARLICMTWMVFALFGAVAVGYIGLAYFANNPLADGEKVFMLLASALANPWIAGFLLAAILAAVMSTIDSQLLVCCSALVEDIYRPFIRPEAGEKELVWLGRGAVIVISLIALLIAGNPDSKVLGLVAYAWGGFGAAFGPVILFSLFWRRTTALGALAGMVVGAVTVIVWKQLSGGIFEVYEILPGFIFCSIAIVVVSLLKQPEDGVTEMFDAADAQWSRTA